MTRIWLYLFGTVLGIAQTLPRGFSDDLVAQIPAPTALAFTPDGRILVTTQPGALRIIAGDRLLPAPAFTIPASVICSNSERGLLGVAVDPEFAQNSFVYLYYTLRRPGGDCSTRVANYPVNRVSRFILDGANSIDSSTERVLLDNIPSFAGNHNAGDLQFGKDGYLYVSVGDSGCDFVAPGGCAGANDAARDTHTLLGKILRIDREGNVPPSNPWQGAGTARCNQGNAAPGTRCQETYSWGLRNPFRIAFDPDSAITRFHINDVGQGAWEEIDLGAPGADFGWNEREGFCANGSTANCNNTPAGLSDPIYAYRNGGAPEGSRAGRCASISGGAFVPKGLWTPALDGAYLFSDYICGAIFSLNSVPPLRAADFALNLGANSAVHLAFGPWRGTRALFYTSYVQGGRVRRISYLTAVSAASFVVAPIAPDSIVSLFGADQASQTAQAARAPLPESLAATRIRVRDAQGAERFAGLYFVSPRQTNLVLPPETAEGPTTLEIVREDGTVLPLRLDVARVAPSIFTATQAGSGPPIASVAYPGGETVPVYRCGATPPSCVPNPVEVRPGAVLVFAGTGIRGRTSIAAVEVTIGGVPVPVEFAGAQSEFPGLDQINVSLPPQLAGRGEVDLWLRVDGRAANPVRLSLR